MRGIFQPARVRTAFLGPRALNQITRLSARRNCIPRITRQRFGLRQWAPALPLSTAGRTFIRGTTSHPLESGESAPLHRRTPKRRRLPAALPESRASVLECGCGRSPLPLSNAKRTFIQRTISPPARERRIRSAPSPLPNVADGVASLL
jgi:hypothetical protein